jgi:alanyl-tRNA synthetase
MLGNIYPEMHKAKSLVEKAVNAEDEGFRATIHRGLRLIAETKTWESGSDGRRVLPGQVAFQLHDTYGFPLDLTQVIGREQNFLVDEAGFAEEMKKQRERSKFSGSGDHAVAAAYHAVRTAHGPTTFLGYKQDSGVGRVLAIFIAGESASRAEAGQEIEVMTDSTPFYGRAGGQVGDTGRIQSSEGSAVVLDTLKPIADLIVHRARVEHGAISVGDEVSLTVDASRRDQTRRNHSATHLLHHALRSVLGEHVTQKGSYVGPDKLTFDFSHFQPLTEDEQRRVERLVNADIRDNKEATDEETSFDEAQHRGAMALFGEKYGDRVRMMQIGPSIELCGGTHVRRSGDIGLLKIVSETGIAKGIRRIEALTAEAAEELVSTQQTQLALAGEYLHTGPMDVAARVARLLDDLKSRDREITALQRRLATAASSGLFSEERQLGDIKALAKRVEVSDPKALREVAETLRSQSNAGVVVLGGVCDGRVSLVVAVDKVLADAGRANAGKLVGALAALVGGKGGGRADIAQAGGSEPAKLDDALRSSFDLLNVHAAG